MTITTSSAISPTTTTLMTTTLEHINHGSLADVGQALDGQFAGIEIGLVGG